MVALVTSSIIAFGGIGVFVLIGRRRPVGAPLSWGEAIAAATAAFFLMFWAYGVVPHQWLQYANNELQWTPAKSLWEAGEWEFLGMPLPPFSVNYEKIRDIIVTVIYGVFLGAHVWAWVWWQGRGKKQVPEIETSLYGRPLVRRG